NTVGLRIDDPSSFNSRLTWRIAPTYRVLETGTRFKGTYGTGFKAPSLFQRYSEFGSLTLQPETSQGWDVGVEQELLEKQVLVGVTYFHNKFDNLITFNPDTFIFSNISSAQTSGFESFVESEFCETTSSRLAYTYT